MTGRKIDRDRTDGCENTMRKIQSSASYRNHMTSDVSAMQGKVKEEVWPTWQNPVSIPPNGRRKRWPPRKAPSIVPGMEKGAGKMHRNVHPPWNTGQKMPAKKDHRKMDNIHSHAS